MKKMRKQRRRLLCRWKEEQTENNSIAQINLEQAQKLLKKCENVFLVDVRSPQEYAEGHIDRAILIPNYEIREKAKKILKDKEATIILYCSSGIRSKKAARELEKLGFTNLYVLTENL